MISEEFVIIPLEVQSIVPYGIGSVKIRPNGEMEIIAPSGNGFGKIAEKRFREGSIEVFRLGIVEPEFRCGMKSLKDGGECVLPPGHRFGGLSFCMSQAEMDAQE